MSMVHTATLEPGARSLPAELRVPRGNAWGWNRLHGNLTPVTQGGKRFTPPSRGVSGLGIDEPLPPIPVDLPVAVRTFPNMQSATAHDALNAVEAVRARYSQRAAEVVAAILQRMDANRAAAATAALQRFLARSANGFYAKPNVSGLGACYYDDSDMMVCDDGYGTNGGYIPGGVDWGSVINDSTHSLAEILAITQGGSVSATGNVYGSPQTATVAAGFPQNQISVGPGVFGNISTPLLLLGAGIVALMVLKK